MNTAIMWAGSEYAESSSCSEHQRESESGSRWGTLSTSTTESNSGSVSGTKTSNYTSSFSRSECSVLTGSESLGVS